MFSHEKIPAMLRDRVLAVIGPVLQAHGLVGVELMWKADHQGPLLELTVEPEGARSTRDSVTLDVCAEFSRDLSTALDVADAVQGRYRLQVGSPGLDRRLYTLADYERFSGEPAKLKLSEPVGDQKVIEVILRGISTQPADSTTADSSTAPAAAEPEVSAAVSPVAASPAAISEAAASEVAVSAAAVSTAAEPRVRVEYLGEPLELAFETIRSGQLVVDWARLGLGGGDNGARKPQRSPSGATRGQASGARGQSGATRGQNPAARMNSRGRR
jgi:ribosome maturation factor RimP